MKYTVEFTQRALKDFKKIKPLYTSLILKRVRKKLGIAKIDDNKIAFLVLYVGHKQDIYN